MQRIALTSLLVAGLVMSGFGGGEALAKGNKAVVTVKANGKRFKTKRATPPSAIHQVSTGLVTIIAGSAKGGLRSVSIKSLNFSTQVALTTATLPITVPAFASLYSDNTYKGRTPGAPKSWVGGELLMITFTKFDGSRVAGTFEGTLQPGDNVTTDATFTGGKFDLPILVQ